MIPRVDPNMKETRFSTLGFDFCRAGGTVAEHNYALRDTVRDTVHDSE